ncbi:hypothetical protein ACSNOK_15955 [Streptomyces sp. URMC 126]|uniref:hypothetical protein n=1 Tax=Streptomyces sp. URMC 126 TaxID=3423401 RepID=UPI003F1ABE53
MDRSSTGRSTPSRRPARLPRLRRPGGVHPRLIVSGTRAGLAAVRARGKVGGRPAVVDEKILNMARDLLPNSEHSITAIAKMLGVSPGTLYNHIPDLRELRASRISAQLEDSNR